MQHTNKPELLSIFSTFILEPSISGHDKWLEVCQSERVPYLMVGVFIKWVKVVTQSAGKYHWVLNVMYDNYRSIVKVHSFNCRTVMMQKII